MFYFSALDQRNPKSIEGERKKNILKKLTFLGKVNQGDEIKKNVELFKKN